MVHCHEVNRKWLCKFHITNIQQRNYYVILLDILNTLIIIQSLLSEFRKFDIMWMIWRWDFLFYNQLVEWRLRTEDWQMTSWSGSPSLSDEDLVIRKRREERGHNSFLCKYPVNQMSLSWLNIETEILIEFRHCPSLLHQLSSHCNCGSSYK